MNDNRENKTDEYSYYRIFKFGYYLSEHLAVAKRIYGIAHHRYTDEKHSEAENYKTGIFNRFIFANRAIAAPTKTIMGA